MDRLIGWWFESHPNVRAAYAQDPTYHTQASLMFRVLAVFEAALRDVGGLDVATQALVLRTVLTEVLDTDAALERVADHKRQANAMMADLAVSLDILLPSEVVADGT